MSYNESQNDEAAREKAINDWLPITSSRNAKWWYSTFHNVTAMMVPGKRFDRYHELGQHAFGEKLGLWIVVPQQLVVQVGVNIVYMVTGGKSLKKFHDLVCSDCKDIRLTYFIMIFASLQFVLSHLPNLNSISVVSLAAAVMSLSYSTIAWGATLNKGVQPDVDYSYKASTRTGAVFDFFAALGDIAFAYAGHNVVLEIQATIPSTPEKPSKKPMWRGAFLAYVVVAICYFPVALIGYWYYGNSVEDNILISLEKPAWLIATANMVHNGGWYMHSVLRWPSFVLRWICFRPNNIFSSLHHVAFHLQTQEVQLLLDSELGLHCAWNFVDDSVAHWCSQTYHPHSQRLRVLLMSIKQGPARCKEKEMKW
uniref:Amino acid transporter transmembrane domain-containing protein n=1 Tax=Salix viminalis TaxID=40686 RepID=A0A6N2MWP8_SALVM